MNMLKLSVGIASVIGISVILFVSKMRFGGEAQPKYGEEIRPL